MIYRPADAVRGTARKRLYPNIRNPVSNVSHMRLQSIIAHSKRLARKGANWPLMRPVKQLVKQAVGLQRLTKVPLTALLRGGEQHISAAHYARLVNDPLRPSTPMAQGPHVEFLLQYAKLGEKLLQPATFEQTAYYRNAAECIEFTGAYFGYIKKPADIRLAAERFVAQFVKHDKGYIADSREGGYSAATKPIRVCKIVRSHCYEVVDGNHRIAAAIVRGDKDTVVEVMSGPPVRTAVQQLLLDVLWQKNRIELYQPVDVPEVKSWPLVRRCSDRLDQMVGFLPSISIASGSYLDLGASYGWFVSRMAKAGFDSYGVERDPFAIAVGETLYGNAKGAVTRSDLVRYLSSVSRTFDVVSCFSVLHHFARGRGAVTAEELIKLIDRVTSRVLFFETGQSHEDWFRDSLQEWNTEYILTWLRTNTSFTQIIALGQDSDAVPPFERNYGRTLFACARA